MPRPRDTLLDEAAAQIGIDDPTLRASNGLDQACIVDSLAPGKPRDPFGRENPHTISMVKLTIVRKTIVYKRILVR